MFKYKSYSIIGYVFIILDVLVQTFDLWGNMPWWVYLLIVGMLLIIIAAIKESKKISKDI